MSTDKFIKGQKVFCTLRVSLFTRRNHPMCGTVLYKLPKILKYWMLIFGSYNEKGEFYAVKMTNGKTIFHSEDSMTELDLAIYRAETWWKVKQPCTDPVQLSAHYRLDSWYNDMLIFKNGQNDIPDWQAGFDSSDFH